MQYLHRWIILTVLQFEYFLSTENYGSFNPSIIKHSILNQCARLVVDMGIQVTKTEAEKIMT